MKEPFDLQRALDCLRGHASLLVCPHDDPDPDALAAAWGMVTLLEHELGCSCTLAFEGIIGRAENRAMVRRLGIRLRRLESLDTSDFDGVVLVDTQPAAGNHSAPTELPVVACVDHHPVLDSDARPPWNDVRPDGECTSTIVLQYLTRRGIPLTAPLATAILYALKTDTRDLSRDASEADLLAWGVVSPLADKRALGAIVFPQLEPGYYRLLRRALEVARTAGRVSEAYLGTMPYPDLVAEIADLLVRRKGTDWCLCGGIYQGIIRFSLRSEDPSGQAGRRARQLAAAFGGSAGGHGMVAGGRIPIPEGDDEQEAVVLWEGLVADLFRRLDEEGELEPFCPDP